MIIENQEKIIDRYIFSPDTLIKTKLFKPSISADLVARPRLTDRLSKGLNCKLILVSATAGFGKTTLLSEWFNQLERETEPGIGLAWLSLDPSDNDPIRFWSYFVAAIESAGFDLQKQLPHFEPSPLAQALEPFLTALINILACCGPATTGASARHLVIAMDDYHVIQNTSIHESLAFLIEHIPGQIHIAIASRVAPPLPLARLRARNQLIELHTDDLAFDNVETVEFFNRRLGLALSTEQTMEIQRRVEGWVTGLQLSALSASKNGQVLENLQDFKGDDRHIADFLISEVLDRLPEEITGFLLETSILTRLSGSLCDEVTRRVDCQGFLELLERMHLFLIPLDHNRTWYRYQHMFGEFLHTRLEHTQPHLVPVLHQRACQWFEKHDMVWEAIQHLFEAQDFVHAANLVEQNYLKALARGEFFTLVACLDSFPESMFTIRPMLNIVRAWTMIGADRPNDIEQFLQAATESLSRLEADLDEKQKNRIHLESLAIRATAAGQRGDVSAGINLANEALTRIPDGELSLRSWVLNAAGTVFARGQDPSATIERLQDSISASHREGNLCTELISLYHLGKQYQSQSQLRKAMEVHQQASLLGADPEYKKLPYAGIANIGIGDLQREWDDLITAEQTIEKGIASIEHGLGVEFLVEGYISLARLKQAKREFNQSLLLLEKTANLARQKQSRRNIQVMDAFLARANLAFGDKHLAFSWAKTEGLLTVHEDIPLLEIQQITLAQVYAEQQKKDQALRILDQLLKLILSLGRKGTVIEILILRSLILFSIQQQQRAYDALDQAVTLARPENYVRIFADEGEAMGVLLSNYLQTQMAAEPPVSAGKIDYISMLLDAASLSNGGQRYQRDNPGRVLLQEPLTERELEICRLLGAGYTNIEIGETFCISVNTVRTHRKNIYSKLNVNKRSHAIQKLKELNLL